MLRGVLEVAGGLLAGILLGFVIQYFPSIDQVGADLRLCPEHQQIHLRLQFHEG